MAATKLKLYAELVPETSWYSNLHNNMPRSAWDKLRKETYAKYDHKCGICGDAPARLECHEIWEYDDANHVQRLVGFIALCNMCHHVKHLGRAAILAQQGKLSYEAVVDHFIRVNESDAKTFERHRKQVFDQWRKRSQHQWKVELGEYAGVVTPRQESLGL